MKMTDTKINLKADNWTVKGQLTNFGQSILTDLEYLKLDSVDIFLNDLAIQKAMYYS